MNKVDLDSVMKTKLITHQSYPYKAIYMFYSGRYGELLYSANYS